MPYIGQIPSTGENNNFKILDSISSYTETFNGSSSGVVSVADNTLTFLSHRFITGQRITYSTSGTAIGGLVISTAYFVIKNDQNTIKLASTFANANNNVAIDLTALGTGTTHTLIVAFDSINTKFKASFDNGTKALITRAGQLQISINGVIQQPQDTTSPTNGFGIDLDGVIIFSTAPANTDIFWGNVFANNVATFDISDNTVDSFTGTGSQTNFTLSKIPANNQNILVTIDGVVQYPSDATNVRAYSVSANVITFVGAPGNGTAIQIRHIGFAGATSSSVTGFYGRTGNVGLTTADTVSIGAATIGTGGIGTSLLVQGNARITGILTVGTGSITIDGVNNTITGVINTNATGVSTVGSLSIGATSVISSGRQLQNIASLDATTTATIESAVANAPNTFTDLNITGISTLGVTSATNLTAQQLNVSGISTLGVTSATNLTTQQLNVSGISTLGVTSTTNLTTQQLNVSGISTLGIATASSLVVSGISTLGVTSTTNLTTQSLSVSGISTFTNGPILVGTATSTGTASQPLQVTGGAYVSGSLGIGITIPSQTGNTSKVHISGGNLKLDGNNQLIWDGTYPSYINGSSGPFGNIQFNAGNDKVLQYTASTVSSNISDLSPNTTQTIDLGRSSLQYRNTWIGGNLFVGTATSTGTALQRLQVTGGAYVSGNLGLGTTNPESLLHINGDATAFRVTRGSSIGFVYNTGTAVTDPFRIQSNGGPVDIYSAAGYPITFSAGTTEKSRIDSSGNLGIGTTNPQDKLEINSLNGVDVKFRLANSISTLNNYSIIRSIRVSDSQSQLEFQVNNAGIQTCLSVDHEGVVNIGNQSSTKLTVIGNSTDQGGGGSSGSILNILSNTALAANTGGSISLGGIFNASSTNRTFGVIKGYKENATNGDAKGYLSFLTHTGSNISEALRINSSGNVGIGTDNPTYKLHVNGSFAATTKSFVIDHPTKPNYKLRYASLEGPSNDIFIRGRTTENIIELPEYWTELVDKDSITVNLTPIRNKNIWVEDINNNKVYIDSDSSIDCFYTVFAERKDVEKLVVEIEGN